MTWQEPAKNPVATRWLLFLFFLLKRRHFDFKKKIDPADPEPALKPDRILNRTGSKNYSFEFFMTVRFRIWSDETILLFPFPFLLFPIAITLFPLSKIAMFLITSWRIIWDIDINKKWYYKKNSIQYILYFEFIITYFFN